MLIIIDLLTGETIDTFPGDTNRVYYSTRESWEKYKLDIDSFCKEQERKLLLGVRYGT